MRTICTLAWIEIKLHLREPLAAFFTLAFPLMLLLFMGSIWGNQPVSFLGGSGYVDTAVPAFSAMVIATSGLMTLPSRMAWYRESGVLRRLKATPLHPQAILAAHVITIFLINLLSMALLVITAITIFDLQFTNHPVSVLAAFTLGSLSFFALGFVLAGLLPTTRTAEVVSMAIYFPMLFLSGAGIPRELLPEAFRQFAQILPLTHVVTLLRGLWYSGGWETYFINALVLLIWLVISSIISAKTFRWE